MPVQVLPKIPAFPRPVLSPLMLSWGVALLLVLFYNAPLWHLIHTLDYASGLHKWLFSAAFMLFFVAVIQLFSSLLCWPRLVKPLALLLLFSAAPVSYFMESYGILVDRTMVQNLFETDLAEARDLVSGALVWQLLLKGVLPGALVLWVRLRRQSAKRILTGQVLSLLSCLLLIGLNAALLYKDYSSLFRNHREIRNLAVPTSYLYYTARYLSGAYDGATRPFEPLGLDAVRMNTGLRRVSAGADKPDLLILVLGETARSMNFELNGYGRETNPELSRLPVISFTRVESCGTSTAVSVPCMFSLMQRERYDEKRAARQSNVLDVLQHAGVQVQWRENNSGCKGVCRRVPVVTAAELNPGRDCTTTECFDEQMLAGLQARLDSLEGSAVIVLHQKGSHGPAYDRRVPEAYRHFTPVCRNRELQACSRASIINAYDNSIRYTDHFLAQVIQLLQRQQGFNTAMLYLSDHGESLGENNLYLHGMPWWLAPQEQKQVPLIVWLSPGFQQQHRLDAQCLQAERHHPVSHDYLAHSLLGLMQISTSVYNPDLDLFAGCRRGSGVVAAPAQSVDGVEG